ncbi:MAG: T9SS type A sorting domain-containing protein [Melioribacteraceae bacterium]|nr:T9SS type A sorting domain-containing protein [Melioribacteraceae bacterium]
MKKLVISIVIIMMLSFSRLSAHKEWVHQYILRQAFTLLEYQHGKMSPLFESYFKDASGNFYPYGSPSHQSVSHAIGGAWAEDHSDVVFGYCGFPIPFTECTAVSASHFWNPDLLPYSLNTLEFTSGQFENAFKKAEILWAGNQNIIMPGPFAFTSPSIEQTALVNKGFSPYDTYAFLKIKYNTLPDLVKSRKYYITGVITIYNTNVNFNPPIEIIAGEYNLDLIFAGNILGRLCHLLADMSVPAHVRVRSHPCDIAKGDRYEMEIGGKYWSSAGESCNSMPATFLAQNWTYQQAVAQGSAISVYNKNNPIKFLFYTSAEIADVFNCYRYPNETFNGNRVFNSIDPYTGDNYNEMVSIINIIPTQFSNWTQELNSIASSALVYSFRATAGLLYWFAKEAGFLPQPLTSVYLTGDFILYAGGTGHWWVTLQNGIEPFNYNWQIMYLDGAGYLQTYESVKKEKEKKDRDKKKDGDIIIDAAPSNEWVPIGTNSPYFSKPHNPYDLRDFKLRCIVTDGSNTTKISNEFYVDVVSYPPEFSIVLNGDNKGKTISLEKEIEEVLIPDSYSLNQNYPNPFNPTTKISFSIPEAGFVSLKIFDILGREVETLVNEMKASGSYEVLFDAASLPSGTYFYKLNAEKYQTIRKMSLVK